MTINLLQDRTPGNEYRAVISVPTMGVHMPASAHNNPNEGGVSTVSAVVVVDATGNAAVSGAFEAVSVTPPVTAGAYALNNVVGGQLSFAGVANGGTAKVDSATLVIKSTQTAPFDLYLFNGPVVSTFADHANAVLNPADASKFLGVVSFSGPKSAISNATIYATTGLNINVQDNVVGVLISGGTPTLASTSDVVVSLHASA